MQIEDLVTPYPKPPSATDKKEGRSAYGRWGMHELEHGMKNSSKRERKENCLKNIFIAK